MAKYHQLIHELDTLKFSTKQLFKGLRLEGEKEVQFNYF